MPTQVTSRLHTSIAMGLFCLAFIAAFPQMSSAHDGDESHTHEHPTNNSFFTTRENSQVLPLALEEDAFQFVVYGDRTGGVPAGLKVLEQAVQDTNLLSPDLVMTVGDLIQGYNEKPEWMRQMGEYKEIMNTLDMRWFPVAGNHDVYWRGKGPAPQGQHDSNYEEHFGPLWYTFRHKNAGFVVLYSDEGDPVTNQKAFNVGKLQRMSDKQLDFLAEALKQHKDLDHVFVFLHHPRWIGGGYTGSNWDTVHDLMKDAGNVSAVFAGHIHHMRYDGPKDGIEYYTLATTGGNLSADIPGAGYLHHLNVVTVRPDDISVASLPVGAVMDPTEFTPEFVDEINLARKVRPLISDSELLLNTDGSAAGQVTVTIKNPSPRDMDVTASVGIASRDWLSSLDHDHFTLAAGASQTFKVKLRRLADDTATWTIPRIELSRVVIGDSARIELPSVSTPVEMQLAAVPADYFNGQTNQCLNVTGERSAIRVDSDSLALPNGPFTLEAWLNPSQTEGMRGAIAKTESSEFAIFSDEGVPQFDVNLDGKYYSAKAKDKLLVNEWTHVAGVFDGENVRIYVDGKQISSVAAKGTRKTNNYPLFVGADTDKAGQPTRSFLGKIDEVRITTGAIYTEDFEPARRLKPTAETRLLLHLDRTLGPYVLDHSPAALMGTVGPNSSFTAP
ncbi:MAG: LamG-like jellyroll fold domain-containing protein [Rhodopirellula sp. JB055]|uniref:LamG-like jellyroll fold domain-containing protein n=1 Tax=Rhodopirellula sp. JB055 TaxID=3342846 RepID=UPI00370BD787